VPLPTGLDRRGDLRASDLAYEYLRDWIVSGQLGPGEVIRDADVAELLGVSRTPVREALIRLSHENLVTVARGRTTKVAPIDLERARNLFLVGGLLDGAAAAAAATVIPEEDIDQLSDLVQKMSEGVDSAALQALDERFHEIYYQASGNSVLSEILSPITLELRRVERIAFGDSAIRAAALEEHRSIVETLRRRSSAEAEKAAVANWKNSWDRVAAVLKEDDSIHGG
jgi:DNA-binding GntR family transcriptional regulator